MENNFDKTAIAGAVSFTKNLQITNEDFENIVVGAIEGGINYWGRVTHIAPPVITAGLAWSEQCARTLLNGGQVTIEDVEEDDGPWIITKDQVIEGIRLHYVNNPACNRDIDDFDAEDYDAIFQYAALGEITYG